MRRVLKVLAAALVAVILIMAGAFVLAIFAEAESERA